MKVYIETFGCQMNEYDTEIVKSILQANTYDLTEMVDEADVVLVNTCAVREHAAQRVHARLHEIKYARKNNPVLIGVLGCMATGLAKSLERSSKIPINFVAGPDSYRRLPEIIERVRQEGPRAFDVELSSFETYADVYPQRKSGINAWIAVMRGCDNYCSFCVVPYSRGRERSRSPESILQEVQQLVNDGFQQVTLLGQNVNSYLHEGRDFTMLLQMVSRVPGIRRIRFTSPHPKDFPRSLLQLMAETPQICKHIHLPLQAGNDKVLERMRRTYGKQDYLDLVAEIRATIPGIVLSTDIIVGFPAESDEQFEDTVDVVNRIRFDSAFIFKYSERPGTIAARRYADDVAEEVKTQRIVYLNELQNAISLEKNHAHIGELHEILIEQESTKKSDQDFQGRNDGNKLVIIPSGSYGRGDFLPARITDATPHVLKGVPVQIGRI